MKNPRNWKHTTKYRKAYGKRDTVKYETPFMELDTRYLDLITEDEEGGE